MSDKHYWKEAYEQFWEKADKKERMVKESIEELLGEQVTFYGLGAGSTEFIEGNAKDNKFTKGDADLYIEKYDTFIEVTGPMIKVRETDTLWVRPDKVRNSINKSKEGVGKHHFVIHVAELKSNATLLRAIRIGENIEDAYRKKEIALITPFIRGREERYLEIPYNHECVSTLEAFKALIAS